MDILASIGNVLQTVADNFISKLSVLIGSVTIAFFTPIAGLLFACFALNTADLISGLQVAYKQGKPLTSRKTWTGTIKKIRQESAVIVLLHIIEHFAMAAMDTTILSGSATVLICLTEMWSVLENLNTVNPDGPWKMLGAFLKKKGEDYTGLTLKINKNGKVDYTNTSNDDKCVEVDKEL